MAKIGKQGAPIPDLPAGASVVSIGSTAVAPLQPSPPPVPANPLLAPGAPPSVVQAAVHTALARTPKGHADPGVSFNIADPASLPGRAYNSTFDVPPLEVTAALSRLHELRNALGSLVGHIQGGIIKAEGLLRILEAIPGIKELAAREGIDLSLADTVLAELNALLDRIKPPVAPAPEPTPLPAEETPTA